MKVHKLTLPIHPNITCQKCNQAGAGVQYLEDLTLIAECMECVIAEEKERAANLKAKRVRSEQIKKTGKGRGNRPKVEAAKFFKAGEWERFKNAIETPAYYALWCLIYLLGLRLGEALLIDGNDVAFDQKRILIHSLKSRAHQTVWYKLPDFFLATLKELVPQDTKPLFTCVNKKGEVVRLYNRKAWGEFKACCKRAGLSEAYSPHALRHTTAMRAWEKSKDILKVQKMLRHKHMSTTELYMHVTQDDMDSVVDNLAEDV